MLSSYFNFKIIQIKSLYGFFKSVLRFGLFSAPYAVRQERKYLCMTCPMIIAKNIKKKSLYEKWRLSKGKKIKVKLGCSLCGCTMSNRIYPSASYCADKINPRWGPVRSTFGYKAIMLVHKFRTILNKGFFS